MIRGALQREIHGNLNIELGRFLHKVFEIFHRAKLGIDAGSRIRFEVRGKELVIIPELPISAFYGILKGYDLGDIEPPKEADREFE